MINQTFKTTKKIENRVNFLVSRKNSRNNSNYGFPHSSRFLAKKASDQNFEFLEFSLIIRPLCIEFIYADVTIDDVTSYDVTDVDVDDDSLIIQVNGVYHNSLHQPLSV